jgi:hypothetical protein
MGRYSRNKKSRYVADAGRPRRSCMTLFAGRGISVANQKLEITERGMASKKELLATSSHNPDTNQSKPQALYPFQLTWSMFHMRRRK